jgi:hypothetical protein
MLPKLQIQVHDVITNAEEKILQKIQEKGI